MIRAVLAIAGAAIMLGGCASEGAPAPRPVTPVAPAARTGVILAPEVMAANGLRGVIGLPAAALTRRFGTPRIDLVEGDARKLQFSGAVCVLDIFLYPVSAGAEPTATHVAARVRRGGGAADAGACIGEVEQQSAAR
jgi:hypothetical protein